MANGDSSGQITFIQNFVPPLQAGEYQISVQQTLLNTAPTGPNDEINEAYINSANIAVSGERFTLDPNEVESVFPPANNQGEYSNVLPHILLRRRTLLWERTPTASSQACPWLALLLFDANDPPPALQTIQVGDLQRQPYAGNDGQQQQSTLPVNAVSYVDSYANLGLTFGPEYGESYADSCQAIDVPISLFNAIAPSLADLAWLGSARTVPTDQKAGTPSEIPGTFSLVISNRMPTPNTTCTAYLVSLEGMSAFLPTGQNYQPATINLPDGQPAALIRLVSLANWSFTSVDPTESFEGYLTNLNCGAFAREASNLDPTSPVATALGLGYTAINHQTRQGDTTVSWYRGPFVPVPVPSTIFIPPPAPTTNLPANLIYTADQLVRYDPDNGMMDVTYAGAWELGRLLGLANKSFSVALYNWRNSGEQAAAGAVIQEASNEVFGPVLALPPSQTRGAGDYHRAVAEFIATHLKSFFLPEKGS